MRNPKIAVIGASASELVQIAALLATKNIDLVELEEDADAVVDPDWVLNRTLAIEMPEVIDITECCTGRDYDDGTQHWRGGSIGKGGKIKYRRG